MVFHAPRLRVCMAWFTPLAVVLLGVASTTWGVRLQKGDFLDERRRDADYSPCIADAGNHSLPVPSGAAVEGVAFPRGASVNGVLMVDIATGGCLPDYIGAQVAAAFHDTAGEEMAELDGTEWTAVGGGPIASLVFRMIFAVNAGRLFFFARYSECSAIDGKGSWSNWRQAEATTVFDANGTSVAFEASADPRFSNGWRFSLKRSYVPALAIEVSGHSLCNVTFKKYLRVRLPFTNNLPLSVDAGNASSPMRSGGAVESEALPRAVSVNGVDMLKIASGGRLPEVMFAKATLFNRSAVSQMALFDGTVWTAAGCGLGTIEALTFNLTFAVNAGHLFFYTRYRARSSVDGEWGWSNWNQAEARPVFDDHSGIITFRASAEPGLRTVAIETYEHRSWFAPGWSFSLGHSFEHLEIKLFGYRLCYVTRTYFDFRLLLDTNLPRSLDAGNGFLPVPSGPAAGGDALPRGVTVDGVRIVEIALRGRLPQDIVPQIAASIDGTSGTLMAEMDRTMWSAAGKDVMSSFVFNLTFAVNGGRLFCFTRYRHNNVDGEGRWSNWRQAEARPVLDANGIAIAFDASADPWFFPGWRFLPSRGPTGQMHLRVKLFGSPLGRVERIHSSAEARWSVMQ